LDIQHSYIRPVLLDESLGFYPIIGFGYNFNIAGVFQELANAGSDHGVVVSK
jgi:hypothetical protein